MRNVIKNPMQINAYTWHLVFIELPPYKLIQKPAEKTRHTIPNMPIVIISPVQNPEHTPYNASNDKAKNNSAIARRSSCPPDALLCIQKNAEKKQKARNKKPIPIHPGLSTFAAITIIATDNTKKMSENFANIRSLIVTLVFFIVIKKTPFFK